MKSSQLRRLVYSAHVVVVGVAAIGLANCGGGERPPPAVDQSAAEDGSAPVNPGTPGEVTLEGFDPAKGLLFGDEGLVNCGAQAADRVITLRNPSLDIVKFKAKLTAGTDKFKLNPAEGSVPTRGSATLQIIPNPIPQASDVVADLYAGTVEVQVENGSPPTVIRLHQTARGAIVTSTVAAGLMDFGDVKVGTTGAIQFSITNQGNMDVSANFALGTPNFKIDAAQTATVPLARGGTASKTVTLTSENTVAYTDTLALTFNEATVHCKPPPPSLNLKGKGSTSVGVSPGTINFGQVDCGTSTPFQKVTITSTAAMSFTPVLVKGELGTSPYTLANDANGTAVAAGVPIAMGAASTFVLRVVPKPIPSVATTTDNLFGDTLRIETTAPGDQPHLVTLNETARGAVFAMAPGSISLTASTAVGFQLSTAFSLQNNGNLSAPYVVSVALDPGQPSAPPDTFAINLSTGQLVSGAAGIRQGTLITKGPPKGVQYTGTIELAAGAGAVFCADLPPRMVVTLFNP